jgi:hypothetical protein
MQQRKGVVSLVFTDGFVFSKDFVAIAAFPAAREYEDAEFARICTYADGDWKYFDLDFTVNAIYGTHKPIRTLYCLGRDGRISVRRKGGPFEERIPEAGAGAGQLGYVERIREIAGKFYACGVAGQIYRREEKGWVHFDKGVLDPQGPPKALSLDCIDGSSQNDLYAVGEKGQIWHYDGKSWKRKESPTNLDLNWVRCVSPDEVYVCGNKGRFYRGRLDKWEDFSFTRMTGDFWCVEVFQSVPYLAADAGLFVFDGKKVIPAETGLEKAEGHRLHANDGVLWSFGVDQLSFFDGKKWTYVKHPDNP